EAAAIAFSLGRDTCWWPVLWANTLRWIRSLEQEKIKVRQAALSLGPLFLRPDLFASAPVGGSVAHTAGVANALFRAGSPPLLISTALVPTLSDAVERYTLSPEARAWLRSEWYHVDYNRRMIREGLRRTATRPVGYVYQRYSLHNFAGLALARKLRVPLVLEY